MTNAEFVKKVTDIATNYKTLYVMGCFGAPMSMDNKARYCNHTAYNQQASRQKLIKAASGDTFGFDCVCLIKGVLWGWSGNKNAIYGGAIYQSNGVPDIGADAMIQRCNGVSTDFANIVPGEVVWLSGHIGVYIGDGKVVECTPAWDNCVQITRLGTATAYKTRKWTKHGKLPWISYTATVQTAPKKTVDELAHEVLDRKWGNGDERKQKLTAAGYDYAAVQKRVTELVEERDKVTEAEKKTVDEVAREVLAGQWGNQPDREKKLTAAGYDYATVQKKVNELQEKAKKAAALPMGDIDGDGKITAEDARLGLRASVGLENLTDEQKKRGDIDGDGKITAEDARLGLRKAVGLEDFIKEEVLDNKGRDTNGN